MRVLSEEDLIQKIKSKNDNYLSQYKAMYSSLWGGVITNPCWMSLPVDDHMVHRGDGVFEAIKCVEGRIFLLDEHLQRLQLSAGKIHINLPYEINEIKNIVKETLKISKAPNSLIRIFISRGPGGFTTNPYESIGSQLYVIITDFKAVSEEKYQKGAKVGRSQISIKESWLASTKTCNYLPNVMMKKEAVDRGLDFTLNCNAQGFYGESSTENFAIINQMGHLVHPPFQEILKGTTLVKTTELAAQLGLTVKIENIYEKDILQAREVFMIGTTLDVLPVTSYEGHLINQGQVGPWASVLREELRKFILQLEKVL